MRQLVWDRFDVDQQWSAKMKALVCVVIIGCFFSVSVASSYACECTKEYKCQKDSEGRACSGS